MRYLDGFAHIADSEQMSGLMGGGQANPEDMFAKLESMRTVIQEVNAQFQDPVRSNLRVRSAHQLLTEGRFQQDKTTFICVCISEFLSLYETERMIQELTSFHIDTHNIVVNQLLYPKEGQ